MNFSCTKRNRKRERNRESKGIQESFCIFAFVSPPGNTLEPRKSPGKAPGSVKVKSHPLYACLYLFCLEGFLPNPSEGYFVIRLERGSDWDKLLYDGPYTISSRPIIVKEWIANFCFENEVLREVPLWIRLPKLLLNCWSGDSLRRIGSVIGKPVCANECTSQQKMISYTRMLVKIDITHPHTIQIKGEDGQMVEQKVFYEWVTMYCKQCQQAGHVCRDRKKELNIVKNHQKQWQPREKGKEKVGEPVKKPQEQPETMRETWIKLRRTLLGFVYAKHAL